MGCKYKRGNNGVNGQWGQIFHRQWGQIFHRDIFVIKKDLTP